MTRTRGYGLFTENHPGADVSPDELEFLLTIERYQRAYRRRYPTWREVLFVARCLGYRKVADPVPIPGPGKPLPTFPDADASASPPPYPV